MSHTWHIVKFGINCNIFEKALIVSWKQLQTVMSESEGFSMYIKC